MRRADRVCLQSCWEANSPAGTGASPATPGSHRDKRVAALKLIRGQHDVALATARRRHVRRSVVELASSVLGSSSMLLLCTGAVSSDVRLVRASCLNSSSPTTVWSGPWLHAVGRGRAQFARKCTCDGYLLTATKRSASRQRDARAVVAQPRSAGVVGVQRNSYLPSAPVQREIGPRLVWPCRVVSSCLCLPSLRPLGDSADQMRTAARRCFSTFFVCCSAHRLNPVTQGD